MILLSLLACSTQPTWPSTAPADPCAAGALAPAEYVLRLPGGELPRQAVIWMPAGAGPHDVVVDLHEYNSEPERQAAYSGWVGLAADENAILVGADGKAATWNAGGCCGRAHEQNVDDVAFLDELVKRVDTVACTSGRVLATGIGNGAMMAERWACDSDVPDGVVSVGGSLQLPSCKNPRPVPILHYHGTADAWIPMDGSGHHLPVSHAITQWTARDAAAEAEPLHSGTLTCRRFVGRAPMAFCTIDGMKDVWPGAVDGKVDATDPLADATRGAWAWMKDAWAHEEVPPR